MNSTVSADAKFLRRVLLALVILTTFTNPERPVSESGSKPLGRAVVSMDHDALARLPVTELFENPYWTPERAGNFGPDFDRPVWPPERFKGDLRIRLAKPRTPVDPR